MGQGGNSQFGKGCQQIILVLWALSHKNKTTPPNAPPARAPHADHHVTTPISQTTKKGPKPHATNAPTEPEHARPADRQIAE